jgi:hypothetical protein
MEKEKIQNRFALIKGFFNNHWKKIAILGIGLAFVLYKKLQDPLMKEA